MKTCQKRDFRNWAIIGTGQITVFGKKNKIVACGWGEGCKNFMLRFPYIFRLVRHGYITDARISMGPIVKRGAR